MTDKTPAMPELTPLTGDILLEDRTIYVLNKNGENVWWASVQPGFHDNGVRVSDDQCRAVAADLVRLAALQSAQPAAAVSDAEIDAAVLHATGFDGIGLQDMNRFDCRDIARAILALRPQAVPMTCTWVEDDETGNYATTCGHVFAINDGGPADNGMKFCCYCGGGITAQGAQGEQG